eukprot:CAMPEP_0182447166 /NCGR_PEP_ID=MMETSP1172-20130603/12300_1 /TAXON_ID=708627 /ORGANISM="Timspurckia oligopyrenoides, Strain CCMP3278" /LENGTH=398 /DNA_ID=CAMNT_0024643501 /DNA_START=183 /DNA_END=1376 /DNA_ORIENTATION=-
MDAINRDVPQAAVTSNGSGYGLSNGITNGLTNGLKKRISKRLPKRPVEGLYYKNYFSEDEIQALCSYKNSGADLSLSHIYILAPMYNYFVTLLPLWLAPNVITVLGLTFVFLAQTIQLYYNPLLSDACPRWVYALSGVALWLYQTLDNLDGRQARRTGSSSPLGHLFDHGCDALNVTISGLTLASTLRLGPSFWALSLIYFSGYFVFYTATLEEFFTSCLLLGIINGPNEGLLIMQGLHLATAVFGSEIWIKTIDVGMGIAFPAGGGIVLFGLIPSISTAAMNFYNARKKASGFAVFKASLPLLFFTSYAYGWAFWSPTVMKVYPAVFMWVLGLAFFYMASRMIVSHLTDADYPWFIPLLAPLAFGTGNAAIGYYFLDGKPPINELVLLSFCLLTILW